MSIYYSLDGGEPNELASNSGYADVCHWIDSLSGFPEIAHLRAHGWEQDLPKLEAQLKQALADSPPPKPDVLSTATELLAAVVNRDDAEVITINNGIVSSVA